MKEFLLRAWGVGRWALLIIFVLYIALVIYRVPFVAEDEQTQEAIAFINAQKLNLADVTGERLPPSPDVALNNATVEGVDANENGIRDDVELAIFERYPGDQNIEIRAAMLQYALGLQLELTQVFNSETWVAVTQSEERASGCLLSVYSVDVNEYTGLEDYFSARSEVRGLIFNTEQRNEVENSIERYQTTFGLLQGENCDLIFDN
ncbi:MAG: hypothetical protein OQJ98_02715 [Candidatus Pacebacteria bacterium]|nr:hypothetical protein [Candidatus Paceibacterota bacterium]